MTCATIVLARPALGDLSNWVALSTYQAYEILHIGYVVLLIVTGLGRFFHFLGTGHWKLGDVSRADCHQYHGLRSVEIHADRRRN
jgi:hypothetical protein